MCSHAAAAAEAAELFFITLIISAPLFATLSMKGPFKNVSSLIYPLKFYPLIVAWYVSGYWVALWLPHIIIFSISSTFAPDFSDIKLIALVWSNLVIAVKFFLGIDGANLDAINAFVFAGFPTTRTLTDFFATLSKAAPYS